VVIDPLERWREHGEKPDYAGLLTFAGAPYTQDPGELAGVDWPGEQEFAWQRERGITSFFMHDVRERGLRDVVEEALRLLGDEPAYVTVDIDVLDPAFAPGTGTPEPGGLTTGELLWAVREAGSKLDLVGADLVEVIPTTVGSADITALAGDRIVRELLTGLALKRSG
jgi:agmatinase